MKVVAGLGENKEILIASQNVDFEVLLTESEDELVELLLNGKVDAAVRGSLSASRIITKLKEKYDDIFRASLLESDSYKFLLAPVGIDEGDTLEQKEKIIRYAAEFMDQIGVKPKIAVISGGRPQDKGRSQKIHDSIQEAEELIRITRDKYLVKHYFILIEDAVAQGSNLILAPDGICGNLIFRSLVFLGSLKSHGALTLGIEEILIDTSRSQNQEGYLRALKLAQKLTKLKQSKINQKTKIN